MPDLGKSDLLDRIESAIHLSGWRMLIQSEDHPFRILVGRQGDLRRIIVYIWNLTSGGPASVRPADEFRIQITGITPPLATESSSTTLLLGWHDDLSVFAAFDVQLHRTPRHSASVQVRLPTIAQAVEHGFAFQRRTNSELVVVFAPDQFMNYVLNQSQFHRFGRHANDAELLAEATQSEPDAQALTTMAPERREAVHTVRTLVRERGFRGRVLRAYSNRCAICHVQLRLIEAAHIIPVHIPGSSDYTTNGLALCPSHHSAYDDGLLAVAPNYHVMVNEPKMQSLREENLSGGEEALLQYVCNTIWLPSSVTEHPLPEYLRIGMTSRGWG